MGTSLAADSVQPDVVTTEKPADDGPRSGLASARDLRVWLAFGLLSLIWGSSYLFIRIGVRRLTPETLVFGRLFVGATVIGIIVLIRRAPLRVSPRVLALLAALGTINTAIPFLLISFGEVHVPSGLAAVLNATLPIFSMLLAGVFLRDEPLTARRLGGAAVGFAGVVVLMSRGSFAVGRPALLIGEIMILSSSVAYASGAVFARRMLRDVPSMTLAFWAVLFAAIDTGIVMAVTGPTPVSSIGWKSVFVILWLGVLGSGIAYVLAYYILTSWGASRATLVAYVLPGIGLALGVVVLGETIDWRIGLGLALILAGISFVTARNVTWWRAKGKVDECLESRPAIRDREHA